MEKKKLAIRILVGSVLALGATFVGMVGWILVEAGVYQVMYGPGLEQQFGFTHGSPYVDSGGDYREVFTLHPTKDGNLSKAGFEDGDIVRSHKITGFYKLLHQSKGKTVSVTVVEGGDGIRIEDRKERVLTINVPP